MGTEFGDNMKSMMELISSRNDAEVIATSATKKAKKEKEITYEFEVSGIDFTATRILNGKPTRKLICYLSRDDPVKAGPVIALYDKGEISEITENKLRAFLDGVDVNIPIPDCMSVPYLMNPKNHKHFIAALMSLKAEEGGYYSERYVKRMNNEVKLIRMGLLNIDIMVEQLSRDYNRIDPWYSYGYSYYSGETPFDEICESNFHTKMVKHAIGYNMRTHNLSYPEALQYLYQDREKTGKNSKKIIDGSMLKSFIVLANRYDEPFAIKCLDEYLDNDNLSGISYHELDEILRIRPGSKYDDGYYNHQSNFTKGTLVLSRINEEEESKAMIFDKYRFWEYVQQAITVGRGRSLSSYLSTWKDYLLMSQDLEKGEIKDKYPDAIQIAHDLCQEKYEINKDEGLKNDLMTATEEASNLCDIDMDGWQFRILRTPVDFSDEANQQANCVASYMKRCARRETIVGSLRPKDAPRTVVTVEVHFWKNFDNKPIEFIQCKERFNNEPTKDHRKILEKFEKEINTRYLKKVKKEMKENESGRDKTEGSSSL